MKTVHKTKATGLIEGEAWMQVSNPELTMEDAVLKLEQLGNEILEVDEINRRIKVMDETVETGIVYRCDFCYAYSKHLNVISEHELTHKEK